MDWKVFTENWPTLATAFVSGATGAWLVILLIYNTRIAHLQSIIDNLRAVLEQKLPPDVLRQPQRNKSMSFPLVIGGACLAFVGLAFVVAGIFLQSPPTSAAVPSLAPAVPQPAAPTLDAMGRALPKDPYQPGPILLKKYTRNEAQTMIDALSKISIAANQSTQINAPVDLMPPMGTMFQRVPWTVAIKQIGTDDAIARFEEFGAQAKTIADSINGAIQNVPQIYSDDLYRIVGRNRLMDIYYASQTVIDRLKSVKKLAPDDSMLSEVLAIYLAEPDRNLIEVLQDFYRWRSSFMGQRATDARHDIEAFL